MTFLQSGGAEKPDVMIEEFAKGDGPPLHRHPWSTWSVLIEGRVRMVADDEEFELGPGDFCHTGPNVAHTFIGLSDRVKMVDFNYPGGNFEPMVGSVGPMFMEPGGPDMAKITQTAAEHGVELLGPPLPL